MVDTKDSFIELTPNPVVVFGRQLGRDEINAWVLSTLATGAASFLLASWGGEISVEHRALLLAIVGPLTEKPGIFLAYFREAFAAYRAAAPAERKTRGWYVRRAVRRGLPSLVTDVTCHDPAYALILWGLLQVVQDTSSLMAALLAGVSFFAAVGLAAVVEVGFVRMVYHALLARLRRTGFVIKSYHEVRFLVDPDGDEHFTPERVFERLQQRFGLKVRKTYHYRDLYLTKESAAVYNGRKPYLRFRQRRNEDGTVSKQAVQLMYTHTRELLDRGVPRPHRCYATRKDKAGYDFPLDQPMPWTPDQIQPQNVRHLVQRYANLREVEEIRFTRDLIMDPDGLFISTDQPSSAPAPQSGYWIELKAREDTQALQDAAEYIAWKLPVRITTRTKCDGP